MPDYRSIGKGFDRVSWIYDFVVHLVFGKNIESLQKSVLEQIQSKNRALILGGGNGTILKQCIECNVASAYSYCEASLNMLNRAKDSIIDDRASIQFTSELSDLDTKHDLAILPFVLDCYSTDSITRLMKAIQSKLTDEAVILVIDFNRKSESNFILRGVQKLLIWILYRFFSLIGATEASSLPAINQTLSEIGLERLTQVSIYDGWISASQWKYEAPIMARE